jgi:hypothetical protein
MGNSLGYLSRSEDDSDILAEAYRVSDSDAWLLVDVADGELVKQELSPNAWHEVDDLVVCREREIRGGCIYTREMVISKTKGLQRDKSYAIRIFEPDRLMDLVSSVGYVDVTVQRGFSPHGKPGDYGFMNRRVLVTARKP